MNKLGIEILSCNIQNVTDEQNLIKDLGADNTWRIKKDAAVTKAQSEKEIAIAQAEANKEANDARVISETAIAERNNELEIKRADLKKESDVKKAMSDAAYADLYFDENETAKAKEYLQKTLELNPKDIDAYIIYAKILSSLKILSSRFGLTKHFGCDMMRG